MTDAGASQVESPRDSLNLNPALRGCLLLYRVPRNLCKTKAISATHKKGVDFLVWVCVFFVFLCFFFIYTKRLRVECWLKKFMKYK